MNIKNENLKKIVGVLFTVIILSACSDESSNGLAYDEKYDGLKGELQGVWTIYSPELEFGFPNKGIIYFEGDNYISYLGAKKSKGDEWGEPRFSKITISSIKQHNGKDYLISKSPQLRIPVKIKDGVLTFADLYKKYYKASPRVKKMFDNLKKHWKDKEPASQLWSAIDKQNVGLIKSSIENGAWVNAYNYKHSKSLVDFASKKATSLGAILPIYESYLGGVSSKTLRKLNPKILEEIIKSNKLFFINKKARRVLFKKLFSKNIQLADVLFTQFGADIVDFNMLSSIQKNEPEKWALKRKIYLAYDFDKYTLADYISSMSSILSDVELLAKIEKSGIDFSKTRYESAFKSSIDSLVINKTFKSLEAVIEASNETVIGRGYNNEGTYIKMALVLTRAKQNTALKTLLSEKYKFSKISDGSKRAIFISLRKYGYAPLAKSLGAKK